METGEEGCTICQEELARPVKLDCGQCRLGLERHERLGASHAARLLLTASLRAPPCRPGHIYCEECITSWCERTPGGATCPLCRSPIVTALGLGSDGSTSLLPQFF